MDGLDDDTSEDKKDNEGSLTTPNKVHQKVKLAKVDCCRGKFAVNILLHSALIGSIEEPLLNCESSKAKPKEKLF